LKSKEDKLKLIDKIIKRKEELKEEDE